MNHDVQSTVEDTGLEAKLSLWGVAIAKSSVLLAIVLAALLPVDAGLVDQGEGRLTQFVAVLAAAIAISIGGQLGDAWHRRIIGVLCLLAGWMAVSTLMTVGHGNVRFAINKLWVYLAGIMLLVGCMRLRWSRSEQQIVASWLVAVSLAVSLHTIWQYYVEYPETRRQYLSSPDVTAQQAGIQAPAGSRERRLFEQRVMSTEPFANFALTNSLAGFLLISLIIGAMAISDRTLWRLKPIGAFVLLIGILVELFAFLLTKSRSATLGLAVAVVWILVSRYREKIPRRLTTGDPVLKRQLSSGWRKWLAGGVVSLIALIALWKTNVWDLRIWSEAPLSMQFRLDYWRGTFDVIGEHPLLGTGPGNFRYAYALHRPLHAAELVADPHNWLLELISTSGIPAGVCVLSVFWLVWRQRQSVSKYADHANGDATSSERHPGRVIIEAGFYLGIILVWVMGFILGITPPTLDVYLLTIPLAVGFRALLGRFASWSRFSMFSVMPVVVVGLLTNLSAAGGISVPGILFPLAVIVGMGVRDEAAAFPRYRRPSMVVAAVAGLLVVAFWSSLWLPDQQSSRLIARADRLMRFGRVGESLIVLRQATEVDRFDPQPWMTLASLESMRPDADRPLLDKLIAEARSRDPGNQAMAHRLGDLFIQLYSQHRRLEDLAHSLEWYRIAAEQHPTDAGLAVQVAVICRLMGQAAEGEDWLDRAVAIETANPWQSLTEVFLWIPSDPNDL